MYCRAACRAAYHKAARQFCERAIADGRLTVHDLRNGELKAYTLPECSEMALPLSDIVQGYTERPGVLLRFLVEVERGTVASLVKLRFISRDQGGDLVAIIDALKRVGQAPRIQRIA
jgi:hypothetical protein